MINNQSIVKSRSCAIVHHKNPAERHNSFSDAEFLFTLIIQSLYHRSSSQKILDGGYSTVLFQSMKKREASATDSTIATVGTPINTNTIQDANLLDVLRGENLQLLEEKLTNEQKINKLELELTMLKEHQSKTEDYEKIQNELMDVRAESKAMNEMISGKSSNDLKQITIIAHLCNSYIRLHYGYEAADVF